MDKVNTVRDAIKLIESATDQRPEVAESMRGWHVAYRNQSYEVWRYVPSSDKSDTHNTYYQKVVHVAKGHRELKTLARKFRIKNFW